MDALRKIADLIRDPSVTMDTTTFILMLVVSMVVSFTLSLLYRVFYENRATGSQIHRSFLLLGPSITALFIAIQYSLPLSLGLLGALSIIRFRTPIKEPEEVGFIMLLCACSVVAATGQFLLLLSLLAVVTFGLVVKRYVGRSESKRKDGIILVSYADDGDETAFSRIREHMQACIRSSRLESVSSTEGLSTLQFSFQDLTTDALVNLRERLHSIEQIRGTNLYFNAGNTLL